MLYFLAQSVLVVFGIFAALCGVLIAAYLVRRVPDAIDATLDAASLSDDAAMMLWAVISTLLGLAGLLLMATALAPFVIG
ncbi:hypothetical protein [uncultured Roseovarius sp.]|uniref:hypothetical protein n=1 Tax=Roseovarius sp. TaxID=1486281 RepID=UPI0025FAA6E9|nr:hypothetical protein [uncultured Roseovarius sp.]